MKLYYLFSFFIFFLNFYTNTQAYVTIQFKALSLRNPYETNVCPLLKRHPKISKTSSIEDLEFSKELLKVPYVRDARVSNTEKQFVIFYLTDLDDNGGKYIRNMLAEKFDVSTIYIENHFKNDNLMHFIKDFLTTEKIFD